MICIYRNRSRSVFNNFTVNWMHFNPLKECLLTFTCHQSLKFCKKELHLICPPMWRNHTPYLFVAMIWGNVILVGRNVLPQILCFGNIHTYNYYFFWKYYKYGCNDFHSFYFLGKNTIIFCTLDYRNFLHKHLSREWRRTQSTFETISFFNNKSFIYLWVHHLLNYI